MPLKFLRLALLAAIAAITTASNPLGNAVQPSLNGLYTVSSVNFGGVPVGSDGNVGSAAFPLLTCGAAVAAAPDGSTIQFNGDWTSPTLYICPATAITKGLTFKGITAGKQAVILAGTGTSRSFLLSQTGGQPVAFTDLKIDPSQNSGGAASDCIDVSSETTTLGFSLTNVAFLNWSNICLFGLSSSLKANVTITNSTFNGGAVQAAIRFATFIDGGITISGGSCTITALQTAGSGCNVLVATSTGPTSSITNQNVNVTVDPSLTAANIYFGTRIIGMPGTVSGGNYTCAAAPGLAQCELITISQSTLAVDNSSISNVVVVNNANGGITCLIGADSPADKTLANHVLIDGCNSSGNALVEGPIFGSVTDGILRNSTVTGLTVGTGAKDSLRTAVTGNTLIDIPGIALVDKGNTNSTMSSNSVTQHAGFTGEMLSVQTNSDTGLPSTGLVFTSNTLTISGAVGATYIVQQTGNTASYDHNTYNTLSGSEAANPYQIAGTNYTSCPPYRSAIEPTAVCNP